MDNRPYELPPAPVLQALGTLLLSGNELEETLRFVIADEFTQHADSARALLNGMTHAELVERFCTLYEERVPPTIGGGEIRDFCRILVDLAARRSAMVQAVWVQWDTGATQRASRPVAARGSATHQRPVEARDVLALAGELDRASNRLVGYWTALRQGAALVGA